MECVTQMYFANLGLSIACSEFNAVNAWETPEMCRSRGCVWVPGHEGTNKCFYGGKNGSPHQLADAPNITTVHLVCVYVSAILF